jgi:HAD superfamily hydrolase (TIGR01509 family)
VPPYDAILFDFDGVLADSEPIHFACWMETLADLDIDTDWERFSRECVGLSERDTCRYFLSRARKPTTFEEIISRYPLKQARVRRRMHASPPVARETVDLLQSLDGHKLAVVSSSGHAEIDPVLQATGLWPLLSAVICGEDVTHHKPHPEPYQKAAALLAAARPLVVEDSEVGVQSGRAAGFDVLRVTSALAMPAELRKKLQIP